MTLKKYFLILLLLIQWPGLGWSLDLAKKNPPVQEINNITLPRNYRPLYRGLPEAQLSPQKAIEAMLGNTESALESPLFFLVQQSLDPKKEYSQIYRTLPVIIRPDIDSLELEPLINREKKQLIEQLARKKKSQVTYLLRSQLAEKILDEALSKFNINRRYLSYIQSSDRIDFPAGLIYSSTYVDVAKIYSANIAIFDESENPKSVDLNFYNFINNRKWIGSNNLHPDRGEFITPYYIPANQIIGYQHNRSLFNSDWTIWRPLSSDLGLVYMKASYQGENIVLVFDGRNLQNIERSSEKNKLPEFCSSRTLFRPEYEVSPWSKIDCSQKPSLVGLIKLCDQETILTGKCHFKILKDLQSMYGNSQTYLNEALNTSKYIKFYKNGKLQKAVFGNDPSFVFKDTSVFQTETSEESDQQ